MPRSPTYSPPTFGEFKTVIARTLRDEDEAVFSPASLGDFVWEGLSSLSGYRPIETVEVIAYFPANYGDIQSVQPDFLTNVWQVIARNTDDPTRVTQSVAVPYGVYGESDVQNGWDFYGGTLYLGRWAAAVLDQMSAQYPATGLELVLSGYRDRTLPVDDDEVMDLEDSTDYLCLVRECRALGFQLLNNDRALYQQWLAATNNTDVSPTQLQGMLNSAGGDVERQRHRNAILRRQPAVGPQYV